MTIAEILGRGKLNKDEIASLTLAMTAEEREIILIDILIIISIIFYGI